MAMLTLLAGGLCLLLTGGFQIPDYQFPPTRWGTAEKTRLKYLTNLSDAEMKKQMEQMSADIGVKCVFCHDEKDYASEAKPEKDFARKKIGLVHYLNAKYRPVGAKWEYTCYTCHRGVVRPVPEHAAHK